MFICNITEMLLMYIILNTGMCVLCCQNRSSKNISQFPNDKRILHNYIYCIMHDAGYEYILLLYCYSTYS